MAEMKQYYYSNDSIPFETIFMPIELEKASYPLVVEAPPKEFKYPKFNWATTKWEDTDGEGQSQRISEIETKVKDLDQTASKLENTAKVLETTQQASAQQNGLIMKQMQSNQQMMMQMQQMLATVAKNTEKKDGGKD